MTDTATAAQSGMAMTTFRTNPDAGFDSRKIMFVLELLKDASSAHHKLISSSAVRLEVYKGFCSPRTAKKSR